MTAVLEVSARSALGSPPFLPSNEQLHILAAGKSSNTSLIIEAMAGCAKSTTLELLARSLPVRPSLALAFNKKIKLELESRFSDPSSKLASFGRADHFNVLTLNGLGHSAWAKATGRRLTLDSKKIGKIVQQILKEEKIKTAGDDFSICIALVNRARQKGLIPDKFLKQGGKPGLTLDDDDGWESIADSLFLDLNEDFLYVAKKALSESIIQAYAGLVDFDDQIYMSSMFNGVFPRYQVVLIDEAQDLSPLNHLQLQRCAADRLIVCGDPRQAIYAFRGADSSSMDSLRSLRQDWRTFYLSTTFRCPKKIVARQQLHAPGFTAHEKNREGAIWFQEEWTIRDIQQIAQGQEIAFLCRNNAPLLACALKLIRQGFGCTILGGEIGKSLINLLKKICPSKSQSAEAAAEAIVRWQTKEQALARVQGKEERLATIEDKAECLLAVLEGQGVNTVAEAYYALVSMFASSAPQITLSTGHKCKGLEWPCVVHLDSWRVPSKYARLQLDQGNKVPYEQDLNLKYVIETRSQEHLIFANMGDMK